MRINKFVALATGMSRRAADTAIAEKRVKINGAMAKLGQEVSNQDMITLDGKEIKTTADRVTIILNKPVGYVCSRNGQGSKTIYELLPEELHHLKPIGRLDKDSSGLLLLTNDGNLANRLAHPSFHKEKVYEVELDKPLLPADKSKLINGVELDDGLSRLKLEQLASSRKQKVTMLEGRNRQIRRTFKSLGYSVISLHRTIFGDISLENLKSGNFRTIKRPQNFP